MKFRVSLSEYDRLQYRLYSASKSSSIKQTRIKSWLLLSIGCLLFSWLFYRSGNMTLTYYFLSLGILFLLCYPFYQRYNYKRHYQKIIRKNQKNKEGRTAEFIFLNDFLEVHNSTGEGKIKLSEIVEIVELKKYFYLKLKTSNSHFIIPKSSLQEANIKTDEMIALADRLAIPYLSETDWKWK